MNVELAYQSFNIKLPGALVKGMEACLEEIFIRASWSDKAVKNMLTHHPSWGSRDRKTATKVIYSIVRKYLLYREICTQTLRVNPDNDNDLLKGLLLLGVYQCFPDRVEFSDATSPPKLHGSLVTEKSPWLAHGLQEWMYNAIYEDWGNEATTLIEHLDQPAPVFFRRNRLKADKHSFEKELMRLNIHFKPHPNLVDAYILEHSNQLRQSNIFKNGWLEFQDIGSQLIVEWSGLARGMIIIDYCAGKGGKTLHMASLMGNTGRIIASDIDAGRLEHLKRRASKAGISNLEIMDNSTLLSRNIQADLILVDAPCTGSGTIRRQPDLKFRLEEASLIETLHTQNQILHHSARLVKPKGKLVYATCSIFKDEDERQIARFLQESDGHFELIHESYILPQEYNSDGFYVAVMRKQ